MISEAENMVDCVSLGYLFALVPLLLVVSVPGAVATTTTATSNQFVVYRIHQIDFPHGKFGSHASSLFNLEAITPGHITDTFARRCALFKFRDLLQVSMAL